MRSFNSKVLCVLITASYFLNSANTCRALVIDDFSVDQNGVSAGQFFEEDGLQSPLLFGGSRVIAGGAGDPCNSCFVSKVTNGLMIANAGGSVAGSANVTWDGTQGTDGTETAAMSVDLSGYTGLEIDVAQVTGTPHLRISLASGGAKWTRHDVLFSTVGPHVVYFTDFSTASPNAPLNLHDIRNITISAAMSAGASISYDAVIAVPEPGSFCLILLGFIVPVRRRR
jgi:hypothetical protein